VSYVLAFGVGIATMTNPAHRVPAIRAMAVVTVLAGVSALLYWGWIAEVVTQPTALIDFFGRVRGRTCSRSTSNSAAVGSAVSLTLPVYDWPRRLSLRG
jgi:hypothetical protein